MTRFFLSIYDFLSRHRAAAAVVLVMVVCLMGYLASHVSYEEDIAKFLPRNEQNEKFSAVYQRISSQKKIAMLFSAKDSASRVDPSVMEEAMDYMGEQLEGYPSLQVTVDEERMETLMEFVYQNMPYLMSPSEQCAVSDSLSAGTALGSRMAHVREVLESPAGDMAMSTMQYDPLGLFTPTLLRLQKLSPSSTFHIADGYLFTKDKRHSMITFETPYGASETHGNALLAAHLDSIIHKTEAKYPLLHVSAIGAPLVAVTNAQQIKTDSLVAVSIAVVLIMVLLVWHYRRASDIVWIGASLAFGFLFALAVMSVFYSSISIIVLGMGSIIIGIAVNYPLHFLDHLREVPDKREALKEMVPPLLIGNVTTVAAFFCLVFLDAQAMRDLGAFGSLMLIGTILFVLVFLPLFAKSGGAATADADEEKRGGKLTFVDRWLGQNLHRPWVLPLVCVVTLVLGYFSLHTSFDSNLQHINYMTSDQRHDMALLTSSVKEAPLYAVAEGKTLEEALQRNDRLVASLDSAGAECQSISHFIDVNKQAQPIVGVKDYDAFAARFREECRHQNIDAAAFQPFLDILQQHGTKSLQDFQPFIDQSLGTYIQSTDHGFRIVNYVESDSDQLKQHLNSLDAGIYAFTSSDVNAQVVDMLNDSFNYVGFVCGFVVFFFLWLSFRRIELSLLSFLPLAVGWLWILGLMHLLGVQFNIVNVILASFIFGQGDDYTIFITEGLLYEYATGKKRLASYKRSVMLSAMLMFVGMGCLVIARHPALRSLGQVTIIGMFTVVLMAYYLPPLVFRHLVHGRMTPAQQTDDVSVKMPITLKRRFYAIVLILMFALSIIFVIMPYALLLLHFGKPTERKRLSLHRLMQRVCWFIIHHNPGIGISLNNVANEHFDSPAIIICNHQSVLDLLSIIMLTPKVVFLTNDREWHNPLYGRLIHYAEFYPVSNGVEYNMERLSDLFSRGYSICVFPEGTRSLNSRLLPFHKGAFYLARQLKADLLPLFIHGAGHVVPKRDFMSREGSIYLEIAPRITVAQQQTIVAQPSAIPYDDDSKLTRYVAAYYKQHYGEICAWRETDDYWKSYKHLQNYYKVEI